MLVKITRKGKDKIAMVGRVPDFMHQSKATAKRMIRDGLAVAVNIGRKKVVNLPGPDKMVNHDRDEFRGFRLRKRPTG